MWLILALQAAVPSAEAAVDRYRELTTADPRCVRDPRSTDITVCGLRNADRFRAPFTVHEAGDPMWEPVANERQRFLARTDNCQEKNLFLVGCGAFGLSVTTGGGRDGVELRPMAK